MEKEFVVIEGHGRHRRAVAPYDVAEAPVVAVRLISKVAVVHDEVSGDFADAAGLDLVGQLLNDRVHRAFPLRLEMVRERAVAEVWVAAAHQNQIRHASRRVGEVLGFDGGAEDEVGTNQLQGCRGRNELHVGGWMQQAVGVPLIKDLPIREPLHLNAPGAAIRVRLP